MNKQQEALKLALEALKELRMLGMNAQWHDSWLAKPNEAIAAICDALAEQPAQQQEPVAWILKCGEQQELWWEKPPFGEAVPLYTSPQPSKPLTDEQRRETISNAWNEYLRGEGHDSFSWYLSQAIEAAHGIKGDA